METLVRPVTEMYVQLLMVTLGLKHGFRRVSVPYSMPSDLYVTMRSLIYSCVVSEKRITYYLTSMLATVDVKGTDGPGMESMDHHV